MSYFFEFNKMDLSRFLISAFKTKEKSRKKCMKVGMKMARINISKNIKNYAEKNRNK